MKAQNLTVSLPYKGCDKNCPYCVSSMTGYLKANWRLVLRNMNKVKYAARAAQVNSVLITAKGEPFLNFEDLIYVLNEFREFPDCEVQTNGIILNREQNQMVPKLFSHGLDIVAFSVDSLEQFYAYESLFALIKASGMNSRVALNVTDGLPDDISLVKLVDMCQERDIIQLLIRNITKPHSADDAHRAARWIADNTRKGIFGKLAAEFAKLKKTSRRIRRLQYGIESYNIQGVSVTISDYCIQDSHGDDDIRSLIFQEDGHLYTAWDDETSLLF